jgi:hypothetical protein
MQEPSQTGMALVNQFAAGNLDAAFGECYNADLYQAPIV